MRKAQIIHNPTAGNAGHTKNELLEIIKKPGNQLDYVSTDDEDWEQFQKNKPDVIFLAGGDGTIHKLAAVLLKKEFGDQKTPIHLLPLGTANNIATTLENFKSSDSMAPKLDKEGKEFDCGLVKGLEDQEFFLESTGMGIFPELIYEMKKSKIEDENPSEKLKRTLKVLLKIIREFKAEKASLKIDGIKLKGFFLMVELMNIQFIGPNLKFAPNADPGDGFFDLIFVTEDDRPAMEDYLVKLIEGKTPQNKLESDLDKFVRTIRCRKARIKWGGSKIHVDDELITKYSGEKIKLKNSPGAFYFI